MPTEKEDLELDLLKAQKEKTLAEINVLRRTTPVAESVKVFGSMILGVGGVMAAIAGFQFAEVKAEKARNEMTKIEVARDKLNEEVKSLELKKSDLAQENQKLQEDIQTYKTSIAKTNTDLEKLSDMLSTPELASNPELNDVRQGLNATGIELRTTSSLVKDSSANADMNTLIQGLFSSEASVRGKSYEKLMSQYSSSEDLTPALLNYANAHKNNQNGIYNTLVVLSHADNKALRDQSNAVRDFAESVRSIGPRTSERADKLLSRLPEQ